MPWVYGSLSFHWTASVDPIGIGKKFESIFVFIIFGLSYYYHFMLFLVIIYTNWWSFNYWHYASEGASAGLRSPCPSGVICICNKAMCGSTLESKDFFSVCFTKFIHASTCLLLWWWLDNENACSMFRLLQMVLNLSEMKLPPESDIIFFGIPYSAKIILPVNIICW